MQAKPTRERVLALNSWHDNWRGLNVAVLGLGVTGFSVADTVAELGARVRVIAAAPDPDREKLLRVIGAEFVALPEDSDQLAELQSFDPDLVVVSPGYRPEHPLTTWAQQNQIPVWGDIELAWRLRDKTGRVAEWICVTGTNGKTTTSQLLAHMLVAGGHKAAPVGNIGTPILDAIRDPEGFDVLVVELSSFQLARLGYIEPWASACLNIADDHLDWHGGLSAYLGAKAKVFENTKVACLYNRADDATLRMVEDADVIEGARAVSFGLDIPPVAGTGVVENILADRTFNDDRRSAALELVTLDELRQRDIAQPHMVQNILAAAALARSYGVSPEAIAAAVLAFRPDAHRVETVAVVDNITWIDDSKATNAHAAHAALMASESVVWILGGLLKGVDLTDLIRSHRHRLKGAVVIGVERDSIVRVLSQEAPDAPVVEIKAETDTEAGAISREELGQRVMNDAVKAAQKLAESGDTVLLSPAAASMDQYVSYADRGEKFQTAVREELGLNQ